MNPINLFGLTMKSDVSNKDYIDSKFITLAKEMKTKLEKAGDKMTGNLDMNTNRLVNAGNAVDKQDCITKDDFDTITKSINRSVQLKLNANGDSMLGKLDMTDHRISNVKFPLDSSDAANKLYVQNYTESEEMDVEKLCKIGEIISLLARKYVFDSKPLNTSLTYVKSMYNKYKSISESLANNDVSKCTIFLDLKVNIIKIISSLSKNLFEELKRELSKENLFSPPERSIRKRYKRFLNKSAEQIDPEGTNSELQLLLYKNLVLIDIGFVYLIDSLLRMLLI